jgi:proteasome lid subunit RPN8/RPN11
MNKTETQHETGGTSNPRLVRRWWDTDYPIIARLNHNTFDLVAHPNGPALCDGDVMIAIHTHPDDSRELAELKMKAQAAWREYAWPLVKDNFYPPIV